MKTRLTALLAAVLLTLTGCNLPEPHFIKDIQNILVAGVDMENGQIKLTVVADKISGGGGPGEAKVSTQIYSASGDTIFEAARRLRSYAKKHLVWFHLKYVVIGEEAAREDSKTVLDFFYEHNENRFLIKLMVAKGMSASEFLSLVVTPEGDLRDYFDSLFTATKKTGESSEVRLLDYARNYESAWSDPFIPTVEAVPQAQENAGASGNQNPDSLVMLSGYALFKDNRLAGYLNGRQAIGLNIVINKLKGAQITVTDMHGRPVTLEIESSKADIRTDPSGAPSAAISVVFDTVMAEYHETAGAIGDEYIGYLESQQNAYVLGLITEALAKARSCGTDVFGIGSALYHAYPGASKKIGNWKDLFSKMNISIKVESTIRSTYYMNNAAGR